MGTVKCERCGGHAEASSIEEGAPLIDHAIGLSKGKRCGGDYVQLVMVGETTATVPTPKVEKTEEPKKATKTSEKEAS